MFRLLTISHLKDLVCKYGEYGDQKYSRFSPRELQINSSNYDKAIFLKFKLGSFFSFVLPNDPLCKMLKWSITRCWTDILWEGSQKDARSPKDVVNRECDIWQVQKYIIILGKMNDLKKVKAIQLYWETLIVYNGLELFLSY